MHITQKRKPLLFNYTANNYYISEVNSYKHLELRICKNLSWTEHTDNVTTNAFRKLSPSTCFKAHALSVRFLRHNTIMRPMLEYAVMIWDPFTKTNTAKLERVQKKAVRFIYN